MTGKKLMTNTLKANALFSLVSGLSMIVFQHHLPALFALAAYHSLTFTIIGSCLLFFSAIVFAVSIQKTVNQLLVNTIIILDILWVIDSLLIALTNVFNISQTGLMIIVGVAVIIGVFAYLQRKGLTNSKEII